MSRINGEADTKKWSIKSLDGTPFDFFPIWEAAVEPDGEDYQPGKEIECRYIEIKVDEKLYKFNFLDLFMFIYFIANEELRRNLALKFERKVSYVPYEVSFKVDPSEATGGLVKRRIELPVEDIIMGIARNEALKLKDPKTGEYPDWLLKDNKKEE